MIYKLTLQTEAVDDIHAAYEWHESMQPGLGDGLIKEIEIAFNEICE